MALAESASKDEPLGGAFSRGREARIQLLPGTESRDQPPDSRPVSERPHGTPNRSRNPPTTRGDERDTRKVRERGSQRSRRLFVVVRRVSIASIPGSCDAAAHGRKGRDVPDYAPGRRLAYKNLVKGRNARSAVRKFPSAEHLGVTRPFRTQSQVSRSPA